LYDTAQTYNQSRETQRRGEPDGNANICCASDQNFIANVMWSGQLMLAEVSSYRPAMTVFQLNTTCA